MYNGLYYYRAPQRLPRSACCLSQILMDEVKAGNIVGTGKDTYFLRIVEENEKTAASGRVYFKKTTKMVQEKIKVRTKGPGKDTRVLLLITPKSNEKLLY